MRACILNTATKVCENIIELGPEDFVSFVPYKDGIELAPDHRGQIGWLWDVTTTQWTEPLVVSLTAEEKAVNVRRRRKQLLKKYIDSINPIRWNALSIEKQVELTTYRQILLDITEQPGFPDTVEWPVVPVI